MPSSSFFALFDDIATLLDDVSVMTKVATKKTAGVLGDDLALNAQQVSGINADRELPVVWAVAKGSLKNKLILVPMALLISAFVPWLITPLLMVGGAFLCYEGCEKLAHSLLHSPNEDEAAHAELLAALTDPAVDLVAFERDKIAGAIRTDFVLSAEIIAITLGTVASSSFATQVTVMTSIALVMTVGVYGIVAGIVKMDDAGLYLSQHTGHGFRADWIRRSADCSAACGRPPSPHRCGGPAPGRCASGCAVIPNWWPSSPAPMKSRKGRRSRRLSLSLLPARSFTSA